MTMAIASKKITECDYCHVGMSERQATMAQPYPYRISGLKDVSLVGIILRECAKCGTVVPVIPRIAELHDVIARALVRVPRPLRGDEIRFLRKSAALPARIAQSPRGSWNNPVRRPGAAGTLKMRGLADLAGS